MKFTLSLYLSDRSLVAAHRRLKDGQVNEPKTVITGFSARSRESRKSLPLISLSVKFTAVSPTANPVSSKLPSLCVIWQFRLSISKSTGSTDSKLVLGLVLDSSAVVCACDVSTGV